MNRRQLLKLIVTIAGVSLLSTPLLLYGWMMLQRPPQTHLEQRLFPGIHYRREFRTAPRSIMLHIVTIDLTAAGITPLVTPGERQSPLWETNARTTSEFLAQFKLQLAVNASFFQPFAENTPWDFYPHSGDRVEVIGQAISEGVEYSQPLADWAVLCLADQRAQILTTPRCPVGITGAVAGMTIVNEGRSTLTKLEKDSAYPRTAIALDEAGTTLWILVVDGKQWLYSEGVFLAELAQIAIDLGATTALNLDGGGSTTLVTATSKGFKLLNAPIHTRIPMRERPVANHLGFYALDKPH